MKFMFVFCNILEVSMQSVSVHIKNIVVHKQTKVPLGCIFILEKGEVIDKGLLPLNAMTSVTVDAQRDFDYFLLWCADI